MDDVKLHAVRSVGYPGGWKWMATLSDGSEVNASYIWHTFRGGLGVWQIARNRNMLLVDVEAILRAMMNRRKRG